MQWVGNGGRTPTATTGGRGQRSRPLVLLEEEEGGCGSGDDSNAIANIPLVAMVEQLVVVMVVKVAVMVVTTKMVIVMGMTMEGHERR